MAALTSQKSERLDYIAQEIFTYFRKEEFEADWEKVSEGKFGRVYKAKLKLWREKCAIKTFITSTDYRYVNVSSDYIRVMVCEHLRACL